MGVTRINYLNGGILHMSPHSLGRYLRGDDEEDAWRWIRAMTNSWTNLLWANLPERGSHYFSFVAPIPGLPVNPFPYAWVIKTVETQMAGQLEVTSVMVKQNEDGRTVTISITG